MAKAQAVREETYKQALLKARTTIRELLEENAALRKKEPIAVVGMACRFPSGANSPEQFWTLLRDGIDAITDVPPSRWTAETYYASDHDAPGKMYTVRGGFLDTPVGDFDASFFGISPREARALDPQHRLLLEISWEALEHACLDHTRLKDSKTGVFVGMSSDDYAQAHRHSGQPERIDAYSAMGTTFSTAVGRLSYTLGLQGPSMALDTACSSSLVALHLACQSLRAKESDLALAGGVNLILSPQSHICFSKLQTISREGKCKSFDASADGYVRAEGCGMVVLKRLREARADGNRILAVVRGSAINQDGKTNGLAAPNGNAQRAVIRQALEDAGLQPDQVDYVEAHGTGTVLGDPIEVEALGAVFGPERREPLRLGTVKTNIGHLEPAAGIAGLIKIILSLLHEELPPNLHFRHPNPYIAWDRLPLQVISERSAWRRSARARLAGVSSFGFSGTNAHIIVEEAPSEPGAATTEPQPHLLCLSARDEHALRALATDYLTILSGDSAGPVEIGDMCFSASVGRHHWSQRIAIEGSYTASIRRKLASFLQGREEEGLAAGCFEGGKVPAVAFLFAGQGSQYAGMGRGLYQSRKVFKEAIDRCDALLRPLLDISLVDLLFTGEAETLNQTVYTQTALFALEYALSELWASWGIRPCALMGHSVGEYVAACVAGVFTLEDGIRLIAERGRLMQALPSGGTMAAVFASPDLVAAALAPHDGRVGIAAFNGPQHVVISGEEEGVRAVSAVLEGAGIRTTALAVSHAFHSHLMEPMLAAFERVARQVTFSPPRIKLVSNITGATIGADIASPQYWVSHIRRPVAFAAGMKTLRQEGVQVFVELGPQSTLLGMGRHCLAAEDGTEAANWLPSLQLNALDSQVIYRSLGALYATGAPVDWETVHGDQDHRWTTLPSYPFQRKRFWVDSVELGAPVQRVSSPLLTSPLLDRMTRSPLLESILFETRFGEAELPWLADHRIFGETVVSGACLTSMILGAAAQAFGEGMIHLSDVVLHQALVIPGAKARLVHLAFTPDGKSAVPFRLVSMAAASEAEQGVLHVTGNVQVLPRASPEPPIRLSALREKWNRLDTEITGEAVYEALQRHHIVWGPSNKWLESIRFGSDEAIGRLGLPDSGERSPLAVDGYQLHPGLIDSYLSVLMAATGFKGEETLIPFAMERFSLLRPSQTKRFWAHARRRVLPEFPDRLVGDLWLMDETGDLIAECLGLEGRAATAHLILRDREKDLSEWFYQFEWIDGTERRSTIVEVEKPENWLIFMDDAGYGTGLVERLRAHGHYVIGVAPGPGFERSGGDGYRINPVQSADMALLLQAVFDGKREYFRVVYLWGLNVQAKDAGSLEASIARTCAPVLHLVQAIGRIGHVPPPSLTLVTKGAQSIGSSGALLEPVEICQAPLWGLGKTIALERPELGCRRIDLDPRQTAESVDFLLRELLYSDREDQIALRGDIRLLARLTRYRPPAQSHTFPVREDGNYLICGGLGGLGRLLARELAVRGARHLTLCGRSPVGPEAGKFISELERLGVGIRVCQADLTHAEDVEAVIAAASVDQPITGIIHVAGVLDDGILDHLDWARFSQVLAVKTVGLYHLHEMSRHLSLDFFIGFSSMASLIGSPAQGPYVAANSFVDALMHTRRAQGLPGLSINWGPWSEVGMAARLDAQQRQQLSRQGIMALSPEDAFRALDRLWPDPLSQVGIMDIKWPEFLNEFPRALDLPLLESVRPRPREKNDVETYALRVPAGGTLEGLAWQPAERRSPAEGEVEIQVWNAGLNFKDVLLVLHMVPAAGPVLGGECVGEIVRVGAGVTTLSVGEAVLAMAPGSLARHVTVPAYAVARLPTGLGFEAGAGIPVAFLTAVYALRELANVQAGERVLIHAATGGVGQAAIQVAQAVGAEIFATASASKWEVLRGLGVAHIMNSRSLDFVEEVRRLTKGEGVDAVLNSLRGEFATQSLTLLRPGGRFVEIGVREVRSAQEVATLAPGVRYEAFDLLEVYREKPEVIRGVLAQVVAALAAGQLRPIPHTVFPMQAAKQALQLMLQAKHTGKLVLSLAQPSPPHLHKNDGTRGRSTWIEQLEQTPVSRRRTVLTSLVREEIGRVLEAGADHGIAPRQRLFDLGFDSLMAVELRNRLSSALMCSLSTTLLFDYPTLEALVDHLYTVVPGLASEIPATAEPKPSASVLDAKKAALDQMSQAELEDLLAEKLRAIA